MASIKNGNNCALYFACKLQQLQAWIAVQQVKIDIPVRTLHNIAYQHERFFQAYSTGCLEMSLILYVTGHYCVILRFVHRVRIRIQTRVLTIVVQLDYRIDMTLPPFLRGNRLTLILCAQLLKEKAVAPF